MFRQRIQEKYEELSPRFRILADFILENTLDAGFLTATELARRVNVDPATVVRFSQDLGYSGYRELSREIKHYVNQELALRYQRENPEVEDLAGKIARLTDETSDRVLALKAEAEQIAAVAELLHKAETIFIISKNEGYGLASLWATYLNLAGLKAYTIHAEATQIALLLRDIQSKDLIVALALGLDPDLEIGHMLGVARERNIPTVAITTSPTLYPARQTNINLTVPSRIPAGYPTFDTVAVLLSLLWQALLTLDGKEAQSTIKWTLESLNLLAEQQDKIPPYDLAALLRLWGQE